MFKAEAFKAEAFKAEVFKTEAHALLVPRWVGVGFAGRYEAILHVVGQWFQAYGSDPRSDSANANNSVDPCCSLTPLGKAQRAVCSRGATRPPFTKATSDSSLGPGVRGLLGQVMRNRLPDLRKQVLDRIGGRFDRFAGKPAAAAAAVLVMKTEGDAAEVVHEFARKPGSQWRRCSWRARHPSSCASR